MILYKVYFYIYSSSMQCYVLAKDTKEAESKVLTTYKSKYNTSNISISRIDYEATENYYDDKLTFLII